MFQALAWQGRACIIYQPHTVKCAAWIKPGRADGQVFKKLPNLQIILQNCSKTIPLQLCRWGQDNVVKHLTTHLYQTAFPSLNSRIEEGHFLGPLLLPHPISWVVAHVSASDNNVQVNPLMLEQGPKSLILLAFSSIERFLFICGEFCEKFGTANFSWKSIAFPQLRLVDSSVHKPRI